MGSLPDSQKTKGVSRIQAADAMVSVFAMYDKGFAHSENWEVTKLTRHGNRAKAIQKSTILLQFMNRSTSESDSKR